MQVIVLYCLLCSPLCLSLQEYSIGIRPCVYVYVHQRMLLRPRPRPPASTSASTSTSTGPGPGTHLGGTNQEHLAGTRGQVPRRSTWANAWPVKKK